MYSCEAMIVVTISTYLSSPKFCLCSFVECLSCPSSGDHGTANIWICNNFFGVMSKKLWQSHCQNLFSYIFFLEYYHLGGKFRFLPILN